MTDLNLFSFITTESDKKFFDEKRSINGLDHDFIPIIKYGDKSGWCGYM